MNSVPLIPKPRTLPNLDALPVIRDLFQDEFQSALQQGSSRNLTKTILTSLQYNSKPSGDEKELFARSDPADIATLKRENLLSYSKNIFQAYLEYDKELENITEAEKNVFEANVASLKREATTLENKALQELFLLKRQPLMKALDMKYVRKYKLLQSEAGLPPSYKADSDFRVQNFVNWKKRLESISQDSVIGTYMKRSPKTVAEIHPKPCSSLKSNEFHADVKKIRKPRPKRAKSKPEKEIFRAEPKIVFFTDYSPGEVYTVGLVLNALADIQVKNIHFKGVEFQIKPMSPDGPFFVYVKNEMTTKKLYPGLSFQLTVEFCPKSLDVIAEDIYIVTEDGKKLLIPLVAYLEPPILKTHRDIDELTKSTVEKIASSCIECGACFTGDTKVTKLKFKCFRGSGEYFVMSSENWNRTCVDSVTNENLLEIPPFRVYPVYFKMDKNEVIDLYVEFSPKQSGTHVENVVVACDNGEIRSLDLLGDAIGWHSYFFSFQDDLLKEIPVDKDDDVKVKYYIDFKDTAPSGEVEKNFAISNNSGMSFEFQWKIREANIASVRNKYLKLGKFQVKIKPESGTLHANSICEFNVKIVFDNAEIGDYRMVLSLYVLNLPYQCIEEDNTVIQPTGLVRNLYSQSLYGEEEFTTPSPELLSLQGTYESLQDSIKSYVEYQTKAQAFPKTDFCRTTCIPNPGLCAKPLKKSKTYFNIGDEEGLSCICRGRTEESNSETCTSNDKTTESSAPRNDVVWDFVDILVDEVELWVEVTPLKITVEPCVLDFSNSLVTNSPPEFKEVRITNHSQSPARCFWKRLNEQLNGNTSSVSLYHNSHMTDPITESSKRSTQNSDLNSERTSKGKVEKFHERLKDTGGTEFVVPGWSSCVCCIGVSANKPGSFNETVVLNVHGSDLQCRVLVQGTITVKYLSVTPHTLNFRFVKQGTRFLKEYSVKNEYSEPLQLNVNQYHIDHSEINYLDSGTGNRGSCEIGKFSLGGGEAVSRVHYLDARVPGLKVSLLEIKTDEPVLDCASSQYVMIVSDVRVPSLHIYTKRFGNAILAPSGMMYVGKKVTCSITLKNKGHLNTAFVWGHPFGCHSRKIKLDIQPKTGTVKKQEKLTLSISLTPLDEVRLFQHLTMINIYP
ncbi:hypothetical protein RUM44_006822 [Polyplax serrata]|uniref:Uncharacterized protein n=1 Tax=Polyplax serrata TaxID=468196 RepID=A0ABR1AKW3_POLSC